jgi:hypothetical protein
MWGMDDFPPGPRLGTLRAASANLMVGRIDDQLRATVAAVARMQTYRLTAQAFGATPEEADRILYDVQGLRAGSTPTEDDYATAIQRLGK